MKIVSSVGPIGSGKDTVIRYISEKYGFVMISIGDIVREIAKSNGVVPSRDNLHKISEKYLRTRGESYFVNEVIRRIRKGRLNKIAVTGVRTPTDVAELKRHFKKDFVLIFVDTTDPKKRFERLKIRKESRDPEAWNEFVRQDMEEEELFSLSETSNLADHTITNDEGVDELFQKIDAIMEKELSQDRKAE